MPSRPELALPPRLVKFQQAMPEYGPQARQERLGPQLPDGYVTHREISD